MYRTRNILLSLGAAIASTKLVHLISDLELDDVLRPIGLTQRRGHWPQNLALLGAGIVVGGVAALLLAPSSGQQTRARLAKKADELGEVAVTKAREIGAMYGDVNAEDPGFGNGHGSPTREPT